MGSNSTTVENTPTSIQAPFASNTLQQVTKSLPAATQPFMSDIATGAQNLYGANILPDAINSLGSTQQPYNVGAQFLQNAPNGITSQMQTPLAQLGQVASGANSINTGDLYSQLFSQGRQFIDQAQPLASNTSGALTGTQQAILDQNAERLGNRLASQYSGSGRYGSFGAGIGLARGISETNNPLMAQYNQQNIGNSLTAMGLQQGAAGLQQQAAGGLSSVQQQNIGNQMNAANAQLGTYNQGIQNQQRQMAMQPELFNLAMAGPNAYQQQLNNYAGTLSSMYPMLANAGTITTEGNTSGFQTNTPTGTSTTTQDTPWTTYAGLGIAGVGAAGRMFSDRRLKTDIKKVGKDPWTALNMYQWRYKGQPKSTPKFVGPMAQEVQKKYPEAVGETAGGILYLKKKVA